MDSKAASSFAHIHFFSTRWKLAVALRLFIYIYRHLQSACSVGVFLVLVTDAFILAH